MRATGATVEEHLPPDIADARPAWEAVIRADGFAWLWRLIEAAGTPGHGSFDTFGWVAVRPGEPLAGDALTAAVERARRRPGAPPALVRAVRPARVARPAAAGGPSRRDQDPDLRRHVQRDPQPHGLARRGRARRARRPRACRSACSSWPSRGARTSRWPRPASSRPPPAAGRRRRSEHRAPRRRSACAPPAPARR